MNVSDSDSDSDSCNHSDSAAEWASESHSAKSMLVQQIVGIVITGAVILLGLLGNSISFVLLSKRSKASKTSMFIILRTLLLSDSAVLFFYFLAQILPNLYELFEGRFFVLVHKIHGHLLRASWPLIMTAQMTSVWLTVLISVERWFAVCKPFVTVSKLTKARTRMYVYCISACTLMYNLPRYFEYDLCVQWEPRVLAGEEPLPAPHCASVDLTSPACLQLNATTSDELWEWTWTFVDKSPFGASHTYARVYCSVLYSLTAFLVPVLLIAPLNTMIIMQLRKSRRQWRHLTHANTNAYVQRNEERLTLLPIWIVGLFCFCNIPSTLINIIEASSLVEHPVLETLVPHTNLLATLNSAINCVVYCTFTRRFWANCMRVISKRQANSRLFDSLGHSRAEVCEQRPLADELPQTFANANANANANRGRFSLANLRVAAPNLNLRQQRRLSKPPESLGNR